MHQLWACRIGCEGVKAAKNQWMALLFVQLQVAEAVLRVVVDEARGLHEGVHDRGAHEAEAALEQGLAHDLGGGRLRGDFGHRRRAVDDGLAVDEAPEVGVEAAELALHLERRLGVADGRRHLGSIADDARVGEQAGDVIGAVRGDAGDIEAVEGAAVALATAQDGVPAQAGLGAFQGEHLEQVGVVVHGDAPLFVVVAHHEVVIGAIADPGASSRGRGHGRSVR